mgnify:CR=1 FL=1
MTYNNSRIQIDYRGKWIRMARCDKCGQEFDVYQRHCCDLVQPHGNGFGCFFPVACSITIVLVMAVCCALDRPINPSQWKPTLAPDLPPAQSILESR